MQSDIVQVGEVVLRQMARPLSGEEIKSTETKQLIERMQESLRDKGVGLAAPQLGLSLQIAVIEDHAIPRPYFSTEAMIKYERVPIPFHVIINPKLYIEEEELVEYFEGCLSISGYAALVPRAKTVRVECLNERAEPVIIKARGWYARILQHEIDHLSGTLYLDRMDIRTFMTVDNLTKYWADKQVSTVREAFGIHLG